MLAGLAPFIYKISTWTPLRSSVCDILWPAHHMEREFGEEGQWQRPEQRKRMQGQGRAMQMMGCVGRGVWLVFKTRQMEECLRPKRTVKDHQEKIQQEISYVKLWVCQEYNMQTSRRGDFQREAEHRGKGFRSICLFIQQTIIEKEIFQGKFKEAG